MNDILRGTPRAKLINSLLTPTHLKVSHGQYAEQFKPDVIVGVVMTDSRLDDEQSVAVIEFSDTPQWLQYINDDPYGFPKKTAFGTLWRGVDTSAVDELGRSEYIRAVMEGTPNLLYAEMLAEFDDTDVNIQDAMGRTALHWASAHNLSEMVMLCLSVPECEIGLKDNEGLTAFDLSLRAANGNETIPTMFYKSMFDIGAIDPQAALLRSLTVSSVPIPARSLFPGEAMFDPVKDSNLRLVKALIDRGVELTTINGDGDTALHVAAKVGNVETATMLLQAGSDVDARGERGATPLHCAIHAADMQLVQLFLDGEAMTNVKDDAGKTALELAEDGQKVDLVVMLREAIEGNHL